MIWRVANAFRPNHPINIDRVLGASYNTRSVLEALIAHTPQFYFSYPGRIEILSSSTKIQRGHKHLIWTPGSPHAAGVLQQIEADTVISEIPSAEVVYEALVIPEAAPDQEMDIELRRRHAQIQVALVKIGRQFGYRSWVAQNDRGIVFEGRTIAEMEGVIARLADERILAAYSDAVRAAHLVDCLWFSGDRDIPAVMEVEHSTGVTSGLTRMKGVQDALPRIPVRYVIVAPDEERDKVVREANRPQFREMDTRFFPYSSVEELYSLCQRRKITGMSDAFLDSYMEKVVSHTV